MSERLNSHEIEDVLSSIRRLVSEDLRPALRRTGTAGLADVPANRRAVACDSPPDKLVLTQALRVVPHPQPAEPPTDEPPASLVAAQPVVFVATDMHLDAPDTCAAPTVAEPASALTPLAMADTLAFRELPEPPPEPETIRGGFSSADPANAGGPDFDWDGDLIWASAASHSDLTEEDVPQIRDASVPLPETGDDVARRGHWTAETVPQVAWIQDEEDWSTDEPVSFAPHRRAAAAGAPVIDDPLARAWADRAESDLRAQLHADLARERAEAVTPPGGDAGAPPPPPRDTGRGGEGAGGSGGGAGPGGPGLFDGSDPGLDDEMLRDIVREIIREELAGTLGERITRNVRKLVRVEINRALTAREFE